MQLSILCDESKPRWSGPEAEGMRFKVWKAPWTEKTSVSNKDSGPLYTLASRKPPLFERIGRQCLNWLSGR
jgi:hypothetical protein